MVPPSVFSSAANPRPQMSGYAPHPHPQQPQQPHNPHQYQPHYQGQQNPQRGPGPIYPNTFQNDPNIPQYQNPHPESFQSFQPNNAPPAAPAPAPKKKFQGMKERVRTNFDKIKKQMLVFSIVIFVLSTVLEILSFDVNSIFFIIVSFAAAMSAIYAFRSDREAHYGSLIALQIISAIHIFSLIFAGVIHLFFVPLVTIFQVWHIIVASTLESVIYERRSGAVPVPQASQEPQNTSENSNEADVVDNFNERSYIASGDQPHYSTSPQYPSFQPQVSGSDSHLLQKHDIALNLLQEMNFEHSHHDRVRNAKLLEKYSGNVQAVVSELLSDN